MKKIIYSIVVNNIAIWSFNAFLNSNAGKKTIEILEMFVNNMIEFGLANFIWLEQSTIWIGSLQ